MTKITSATNTTPAAADPAIIADRGVLDFVDDARSICGSEKAVADAVAASFDDTTKVDNGESYVDTLLSVNDRRP